MTPPCELGADVFRADELSSQTEETMEDEEREDEVIVHEITTSLGALDDPERAGEIVAEPEFATRLMRARSPHRVSELLETIDMALFDAGVEERDWLTKLAGAVRSDVGFLARHPERFVDVAIDRCRWYTDGASGGLELGSGGEGTADVETDRLAELIERWRTWRAEERDGPFLERRRPPVDPIGDQFEVILRTGSAVEGLAWGPSLERLATIHSDGRLRVYDVSTGQMFVEREFEGATTAVDWSSMAGGIVVTTSREGIEDGSAVTVVDPQVGSVEDEHLLDGHAQAKVTSFADAAPRVLLAGADPAAVLDLSGGEVTELDVAKPFAAALSDRGDYAAFGRREEGGVVVVEVDGDETWRLDRSEDGWPSRLEWGRGQLAVSSSDGAIRFWRPRGPELIDEWEGVGATVESMAFDEDGEKLVASWRNPRKFPGGYPVCTFDVEFGEMMRRIADSPVVSNEVAYNGIGGFASAGCDGAVRMWDTGRLRDVPSERVGTDSVSAVALDPENERIAVVERTAQRDEDATMVVVDLESMERLTAFEIEDHPEVLRFSLSGDRLCAAVTDSKEPSSTDPVVWEEGDGGEWSRVGGHDRPEALERDANRLDRDVQVDAATGETRIPNPYDPDETLIWPDPLSVYDAEVHLAGGCPYVAAAPRGRLEVLEVVGET